MTDKIRKQDVCGVEKRLHVHVNHSIKVHLGDSGGWGRIVAVPRVIDDDIEFPIPMDCCFEYLFPARSLRYICVDIDTAEFVGNPLTIRIHDIAENDLCSFLYKFGRNALAESVAAARDDGNFTVQSSRHFEIRGVPGFLVGLQLRGNVVLSRDAS